MFNGKMVASIILTLLLLGHAFAQPLPDQEILARIAKEGHVKGGDGAPITLIEFSDFQCSFCRKFWQTTLPEIDKKYIGTGEVRFVYRHFAILGKPSIAAAQAADCAGEQGKFWEYHDKLFANAGSPFAFSGRKLRAYAGELGLQSKVFKQCLDSQKYLKKVEGETAVGASLGARGTPTFFLHGQFITGRIVGAQPFEVFESVIDKRLKIGTSSQKKKF